MKKSKFLKKSLAMLLALMLVVAMIPLSAAAASLPNLTKLYIDGKATDVSGSTFAGEVKNDAETVGLRVEVNSLGTSDGNATLAVVKEGSSGSEPIISTENPVDLEKWATDNGDSWTLTLRLTCNDADHTKDYTVELDKVDYGTTASLDPDVKEAGTGVYTVAINNADHIVDIEVPKGVFNAGTKKATFTVAPQDKAIISSGTATATPNGDGTYDITVGADDRTFTITSESKKNVATYTVNVTEKPALNSFSLGEYEGKIDETAGTITVEVDKADLYNEFDKLNSSVTYELAYETYHIQTTIEMREGTTGNFDKYSTGDKFTINNIADTDFVNVNGNNIYTGQVVLSCADVAQVQWYTLYVNVKSSGNTAITGALFDSKAATVDGDTISAVLPVKKADGTATQLSNVLVTLKTSAYEEVKEISYTKSNAAAKFDIVRGNSEDTWTALMDLTTDKIITVVSEDGTTQVYTLSASLAEDEETAYMSAIYLKGDGYESQGNISGNTITFKVPYMTLSVADWKIYATTNSSAEAIAKYGQSGAATVIDGSTTASAMGFTGTLKTKEEGGNKIEDAISAVNMNNNEVFQTYDVVIELITPAQMGKTLTDMEISIQNVNPADGTQTNAEVSSRVNPYNTIKASETISIEDKGLATGNTGTITLKPAQSLSTSTDMWGQQLYAILTEIETANGGVAFLVEDHVNMWPAVQLKSLVNNSVAYNTTNNFVSTINMSNISNYKIVVLPEDAARTVLARGNVSNPSGGSYGVVIYDNADELQAGTEYTIKVVAQNPNTDATISNISVKGNALNVEESTTITGELAYGVTAENNTEVAKGTFMDFELSPHAKAEVKWNGGTGYILGGGDYDGDGEADGLNTPISNVNLKLLFVRNTNTKGEHIVDVYVSNNGTSYGAKLENNQLTVIAENGSTKTYTFDLTWADPNTDAEFTSFGIGNSTGRISGSNITVTVPYGTDLTGLIPTFTTSTGATVTLNGENVVSGKTFVNFSRPVQLIVKSEDGKKTNPYTVTVNTSEAFSDVLAGSWYYDNVMQAAAAGIVSGYPDGTFKPGNSVTRRDFAIMLTQMLGVSNDGTAVSPFIDVDDDDYGVVSIAYCKAHNIISGYDDGTFKPDATITRQEAASMIVKAMGVSKASDELYPDDSTIAGWAKDAVYKAKAAGLMKGYEEDGTFRPTGKITRAEAASIMVNALNQ